MLGNDFQAVANRAAVGTISATSINGWHATALSATAFPYINLTGPTQFRLRFALDDNNDLGADLIRFYSGNAAAVNRPVLLVQYTVPWN